MLIPLLAPGPDGSSGGLAKIFAALGNAAVKACVCIVGIMAGGRLLIQPLYKWVRVDTHTHTHARAYTACLYALQWHASCVRVPVNNTMHGFGCRAL